MPEQLSRFAIECKWYKDFRFHHLFEENITLDKWIEQSRVSTRCWFIIFRANHTEGFVVYDPLNQAPVIPGLNYMHYKGLIVTRLTDFFERNKECMLNYNIQCQQLNNTTTTVSSILANC